jgi:hypothetical protein
LLWLLWRLIKSMPILPSIKIFFQLLRNFINKKYNLFYKKLSIFSIKINYVFLNIFNENFLNFITILYYFFFNFYKLFKVSRKLMPSEFLRWFELNMQEMYATIIFRAKMFFLFMLIKISLLKWSILSITW